MIPGFDRVTWVNFYFLKKSKRSYFSIKKNKTQWVAIEFLTRSCRVTGFSFLYFFFNPPRIQSRIDPPGWAGFQNYSNPNDSNKKGVFLNNFFI
jgi:hypothetical protein